MNHECSQYAGKIILDDDYFLTDECLDALANCVHLEDISFERCDRITLQGLSAFVLKRKT